MACRKERCSSYVSNTQGRSDSDVAQVLQACNAGEGTFPSASCPFDAVAAAVDQPLPEVNPEVSKEWRES
ncbi:MAG TPA: hypothetical protein VLI05_01890 [Candidatus Saccharimonadia bacterium]|nr:hypothetical protein [Candidatus Saccharimonadia bacterium]